MSPLPYPKCLYHLILLNISSPHPMSLSPYTVSTTSPYCLHHSILCLHYLILCVSITPPYCPHHPSHCLCPHPAECLSSAYPNCCLHHLCVQLQDQAPWETGTFMAISHSCDITGTLRLDNVTLESLSVLSESKYPYISNIFLFCLPVTGSGPHGRGHNVISEPFPDGAGTGLFTQLLTVTLPNALCDLCSS